VARLVWLPIGPAQAAKGPTRALLELFRGVGPQKRAAVEPGCSANMLTDFPEGVPPARPRPAPCASTGGRSHRPPTSSTGLQRRRDPPAGGGRRSSPPTSTEVDAEPWNDIVDYAPSRPADAASGSTGVEAPMEAGGSRLSRGARRSQRGGRPRAGAGCAPGADFAPPS